MEDRKYDHIELAFRSQLGRDEIDRRFYYEPATGSHPKGGLREIEFLGKKMNAPIWISSMTGGTELAGKINRNLAKACNEFGLGMGLGSCRSLLTDDKFLEDFDLRGIIGDKFPFFANLGIAQVAALLEKNQEGRILDMINKLKADGLIVHVNPLQEWLQPEGDLILKAPVETISELLDKTSINIIVKEVGQGMGPESLSALMRMPLAAIEFASFGGTNFARLELMRCEGAEEEFYGPVSKLGHDAYEMAEMVNRIADGGDYNCKGVIVSGGLKNFLDGYYFTEKIKLPAIYGHASSFLKYAQEGYEELKNFINYQIKGLELAYSYLTVKQ